MLLTRHCIVMGRQQKDNTHSWSKIKPKKLKPEYIQGDSHIILAHGCLNSDECTSFISKAESIGFQHQGSRGAAFGEAYRDNDRISFEDHKLAEQLWSSGLKDIMNSITVDGRRAIGLNSNIRIYKYATGQRFGKHIDESVVIDKDKMTEYTLLVYLSSCVGGETVFYDHRGRCVAKVSPSPGMALIHKHGEDDCLEHEGAVVREGLKYVLRSDVVYEKE